MGLDFYQMFEVSLNSAAAGQNVSDRMSTKRTYGAIRPFEFYLFYYFIYFLTQKNWTEVLPQHNLGATSVIVIFTSNELQE